MKRAELAGGSSGLVTQHLKTTQTQDCESKANLLYLKREQKNVVMAFNNYIVDSLRFKNKRMNVVNMPLAVTNGLHKYPDRRPFLCIV